MNALCSECKCCEAQPDFDKCIFCEDGVPCPNRQRAARAKQDRAECDEAKQAGVDVDELRKEAAPTEEEKLPAVAPRSDVAAFDQWLAEKNRYRQKRKQIKERTNMAPKTCACGCSAEMPVDSRWQYLRGHKPGKKKNKRLCGCGCGTPLVNRHPYIKGHNPDAKKGPNGKARKSKASPPPAIPIPDQRRQPMAKTIQG